MADLAKLASLLERAERWISERTALRGPDDNQNCCYCHLGKAASRIDAEQRELTLDILDARMQLEREVRSEVRCA